MNDLGHFSGKKNGRIPQMTEFCGDGAHVYYHGDASKVFDFFEKADISSTLPEFHDRIKKAGVHAVRIPNGNTLVRMKGVCPNIINGVCGREPNCFSEFVKQNPPQHPQESPEETEAKRIRKLLRDALEASGEKFLNFRSGKIGS